MRNTFSKKKKAGFTIIETMISISLFIVVVMAGVNALLNANLVHRKSQDMRSIIDNMTFILEDMSRYLRTGYDYRCLPSGSSFPLTVVPNQSCASGAGIAFESATGSPSDDADQWVYFLRNVGGKGTIWKATEGPYTEANSVQLNPSEIAIDLSASGFSVLGAESISAPNTQQPIVNIRLAGTITDPRSGVETPFSLQTSISQRLVDILP